MDFSQLLQQGTAHAWLYIPVAILLGALHGLEPGHSKTMMAAFIIAVRGTVWQAALLGLCAALSPPPTSSYAGASLGRRRPLRPSASPPPSRHLLLLLLSCRRHHCRRRCHPGTRDAIPASP